MSERPQTLDEFLSEARARGGPPPARSIDTPEGLALRIARLEAGEGELHDLIDVADEFGVDLTGPERFNEEEA